MAHPMALDPPVPESSASTDDAALLRRVAEGDPTALSSLYDSHAATVFSLAVHIVGDQRDAEEVIQDVFRQARKDAARFDPRHASVGSWLLLLTRARAIERLRARLGGGSGPAAATVRLPDPAARRQFEVRSVAQADRLRAALTARPRLERLAIELGFFEGLSPAQIADRLEQPVEVIRARARSALQALRAGLEEEA